MPTSTQKSRSTETATDAVLILEHVELLVSLLQNQEKGSTSDSNQWLDSIAQALVTAIEDQLATRFAKLECEIEKIGQTVSAQNDLLEKSVARTVAEFSPAQETSCELIQKLDQVAVEFTSGTDAISDLIKTNFEQIFESVAANSGDRTTSPVKADSPGPLVEPNSDETASHWHKQKAAMLSKYGLDPNYRPVMKLAKPVEPTPAKVEKVAPLEPPRFTLPEADASMIAELKTRLNEKLRDAEVELSIGRAKLSRQQAELAEERVELDRRATVIEEKFASIAQDSEESTEIVQRWWHHLKPQPQPQPQPPDVDDRA